MNNYIMSNIKKTESLFWGEEILNIIFINDIENDEILDQVLFLEKGKGNIVGFYMDGMNPFLSVNHFKEFDNFNLYALYDKITECSNNDFIRFQVKSIRLIFNTEYNELCGLFLASEDESKSILLIFMYDEIYIEIGCEKLEIKRVLSEKKLHVKQYIVYEKNVYDKEWYEINI